MPNIQVLDLSPTPRLRPTPFEETVNNFTEKYREGMQENRDTNALSDIYSKYKNEGQSIDDVLMNIQTQRGLSPTARVNALNQANEMKKTNTLLQKQAATDLQRQAKNNQKEQA